MTDKAEDVINGMIDAWDAIPGGTHHSADVIQKWLVDDLGPAIARLRVFVGRPTEKAA